MAATDRTRDRAIRTAAEDIRQTRPFRSSGQEALVSLLLTTDAVRRRIAEVLHDRGDGLTMQQYNVLRILRGAGRDGLPTLEIADRMLERTPGVTRLLDRLERRSWIERVRSEHDRRQVICRLTADGSRLVKRLQDPIDRLDAELFAELDEPDLRRFIGMLDRLRSSIADAP